MPTYAKFLKDLVTERRHSKTKSSLEYSVNSIFVDLPKKWPDPDVPTILCIIGETLIK